MLQDTISPKQLVKKLQSFRDLYLSKRIRNTFGFRLFQNWAFQAFGWGHWSEIIFRLSIELIIALSFFELFLFIGVKHNFVWDLIIAHTIMWTFNGHLWALKINDNLRLAKNTPEKIENYLKGLEKRLNHTKLITACVLSGSITENRFGESSDLDIWVTSEKGFFNTIGAYLLGVRERSIAFVRRIPIELYFYNPDEYLGKKPTEKLLLVKDIKGSWQKTEPDSKAFDIQQVRKTLFFSKT